MDYGRVYNHSPSFDIPTWKHFCSRQNWQRFRVTLLIWQFLSRWQVYTMFFCMLRRKKPCQTEGRVWGERMGWAQDTKRSGEKTNNETGVICVSVWETDTVSGGDGDQWNETLCTFDTKLQKNELRDPSGGGKWVGKQSGDLARYWSREKNVLKK